MFRKKLSIILAILVGLFVPISSVQALDAATLNMFAQNNIIGYDPEGSCDYATGVDPGVRYVSNSDAHGHWDGSCKNVSGHDQWLHSQMDAVQKIASENGLPWEILFAQSIGEASGGKQEICPYNSLGLTVGDRNQADCGARDSEGNLYATFNNYEEMWQYYVNEIKPIRDGKNRFPQDPYSMVEFIEYGIPGWTYATSPTYVTNISAYVCGVQKWAEENGYATSAVTYDTFDLVEYSSDAPDSGSVDSSTSYMLICGDSKGYKQTIGGDDIAKVAVEAAWPYLPGESGEAGTCSNGEQYTKYGESCTDEPKPKYQELYNTGGISGSLKDCGHFVASVIVGGGFDSDFPKSGSGNMTNYLAGATDKWEEVENTGSTGNLKPGDIFASDGHIMIYVGSNGGSYGDMASAWQDVTVGALRSTYYTNSKGENFRIFRFKGGSNLKSGGLTLAEAQQILDEYKALPKSEWANYNINSGEGCANGMLYNCVSFSKYFLARFTSKPLGHVGNGADVVKNMISNGYTDGSNIPRAYAVFSTASGSLQCDGKPCGHTGVVLGIDAERNKIIIGEASCSGDKSQTSAKEYDLTKFTDGSYTFAYTDEYLKDF